ncbi:MAG: hypothetical protein RLZZ458_540 [Planctomycetota bacterium]
MTGYDENQEGIIRSQLRQIEQPRDSLPYTPAFRQLKVEFEQRAGVRVSFHTYWKLLLRTAKKGGIAGSVKKKRAPVTIEVTPEEQLEILRLLPEGPGTRDNLPYTKHFDELHQRFTKLTGRRLKKHQFWRAVLSLAKRGRKARPVFTSAPPGGLPEETVRFLERLNPWWQGVARMATPDMRRWAYGEVLDRFRIGIAPIIAMRGPRQVGKTTIQLQLIEHLLLMENLPPQQILRVQFDEAPALGVLSNPIESIIRWFEQSVLGETLNSAARGGRPVYIFFDEVQNLANWSEQLKAIVDSSKVQILVTGSSALRIGQGRDSLSGRLSSIELGPMRLTEIGRLRGLTQLKPFSSAADVDRWTSPEFWLELIAYGRKHESVLNQAFELFSTYGGYPVCHKSVGLNPGMLATQIVEDVVERTISHEQVKGVSEEIVREVFRLLCRYAGERVGVKRLNEEITKRFGVGVTSNQVNAAIDYLENTLLIRLLRPLEISRKRQSSPPTICLCDHFIRYALLREQIPLTPWQLATANESVMTQAGHLVEGIVGNLFAGTQGINAAFFPERQDEPEVDIVLSIGMKHLPIEVKYRRRRGAADLAGLRSFRSRKYYEADFGLLITQDEHGQIEEGILAIPAKSLLLLL